MLRQQMSEPLRVRLPGSLIARLDAEASRRLLSRSAMVRLTLLKGLGLLTKTDDDPDTPARQEVSV